MKKSVLLISILVLLIAPTVLAYTGYGYGYGYLRSPLDYFENEWTMFGIIFIVFFAIIYFTVNKSFKNNVISGVIALGLSLLIAITLTRRGWLYGYAGEQLGAWVLIVVAFIGIAFAIRFAYEYFGSIGAIASIAILWFLLRGLDPYEILPYEVQTDSLLNIYGFITSIFGLIVFMIIGLIAAKTERGRTPMGQIIRMFKRGR